MPFRAATLRGKSVFVRVTEDGAIAPEAGRAHVRYAKGASKVYSATISNLEMGNAALLPDADFEGGEAASGPKNGASKIGSPDAIAYTDGACSGNPGPAGAGIRVEYASGAAIESCDYLGQATNNVGELTGVLRALEIVPRDKTLVVYTDSQYAIGVLQKGWKAKANGDLIEKIKGAMKGRPVELRYVKGHAGHPGNERADALAREAVSGRKSWQKES